MCGINGILLKGIVAQENLKEVLAAMNKRIVHRGPDDDGFYTASFANYSLGMAMRRLSIIDLNTGSQPIFSEDKNLVIVFNGEIYNYKKLKLDLEADGAVFYTTSDTEVVLQLFKKYRERAFGMLDGMFGVSIFDTVANKLFIARDFFGEKPVYYFANDTTFTWASELKSIVSQLPQKPAISPLAMSTYFQLTYIPAPLTIYEGIKKLEPNSYIEINCNNFSFNIHEIENVLEKQNATKSFEKAKQKTHDLVYESVASRAVSDVPIGTFLSGGVDSSIVSWCLSQYVSTPIDTFSIGFEKESFNETDKSQVVAKLINSNHHEFVISFKELKDTIGSILINFDEPFGDSSALPSYIVSQKTSEFVKVALTGDGGDEVFGGYNKYYIGKINRNYTSWIPEWFHNKIVPLTERLTKNQEDKRNLKYKLNKMLSSIDYRNDFYSNIISLGFHKTEITSLVKEKSLVIDALGVFNLGDAKTLNDFREIDRKLSLEGDLLVKVDRTSMLTSIECRAPFLNKELWNFTKSLPENYLIKSWDKKHILKQAFKQYFPKEFLDKSKMGFGVPVGDWLRDSLKDELLKFIETKFLTKQDLFHIDYIQKLVKDHVEGRIDNTFKIWTFYCFQKWYCTLYNPSSC